MYLQRIQNVCDSKLSDVDGDLFRYSKKENLTDCQNTTSSFYKDSVADKLYIHTSNDLVPNEEIILSLDRLRISAGFTTYAENLNIIGGFRNFSSSTKTNIIHKNCQYSFCTDGNGAHIIGNVLCYFDNCRAYKSFLDGFNYHISGGFNPVSFEIECVGYKNGENNNSGINNGSSIHDDCRIVRIGGFYFSNEGPNVHDVNSAKSFNVDVISYNSVSTVLANKSSFALGALANETCKMWLDGCIAKNDETASVEDRTGLNNIYQKYSYLPIIESGTILQNY